MTGSSIIGIGVDIEQIDRFRNKPLNGHRRLYNKLFGSNEIGYCTSKRDPYPCFTARFCAKEALVK
ncbi:holo-ACP synthase, partial [candidate division KSB1 bacterium]